jgi:hypothetical protein
MLRDMETTLERALPLLEDIYEHWSSLSNALQSVQTKLEGQAQRGVMGRAISARIIRECEGILGQYTEMTNAVSPSRAF